MVTSSSRLAVTALLLAFQTAQPFAPPPDPIVNAPDTIAADEQNTAGIALGADGKIIAGFVDTGSCDPNVHLCNTTGFSRSTDGGSTWTDGGALPPAVPQSWNLQTSLSVLARDRVTGNTYFAAFAIFNGVGTVVLAFRSFDDGVSWPSAVGIDGWNGFHASVDDAWITVDNAPGAGQGYVYGLVHVNSDHLFRQPGMSLSRSTDGGGSFPLRKLVTSETSRAPFVAVGPDHSVYAFWSNFASIRASKSTDLGVTFTPPVTVAPIGDTWPQAAVSSANGEIYVVYNAPAESDPADVFLIRSSDGGATWSAPVTINNDGPYVANKQQSLPSVAIAPDGKHLFVSWYDTRSDPANSLIERWGTIATLAGTGAPLVFGPNFRISTGSWPVVSGGTSVHDQSDADNSFFYTAWTDNRLADPFHSHQPDIRFAKIPVSGPPLADVDSDLRTDRTFYRPSTGAWYSALSNGGATTTNWGMSGDIDVMADYDGDGTGDVAVWRPSDGIWFIRQSSNNAVRVAAWGVNGDIPLARDCDGDGKADLAIFRPSAGAWFILKSTGGATALGWGGNDDIPLLADYDGDGKADPTVFRPSTGVWFTVLSAGGTQITGWGMNDDVPMAGDYDGDGKADVTIFRPGTGEWWVNNSSGGTTLVPYGTAGDIPVSGDWNGDGRSDYTVWRPSNGIWYTQFTDGGHEFVTWGMNGDRPVGRRPGS